MWIEKENKDGFEQRRGQKRRQGEREEDKLQRTGVRRTMDNRGKRGGRERRRVEKKRSGSWDKTRGEARGGDVSLLLSATGFSVYHFGLHTPASENPCSHFGLHSLDVCFLFATTVGRALPKSQHTWRLWRLCINNKNNPFTSVWWQGEILWGTSRCVICDVTVDEQETS